MFCHFTDDIVVFLTVINIRLCFVLTKFCILMEYYMRCMFLEAVVSLSDGQ